MVVHIRQDNSPYNILCGMKGPETISAFHFKNHVLATSGDCCKELFKKICHECIEGFWNDNSPPAK